MISVVVSKWVADALGKEGIYSVWIAMRQYPWLPPDEFQDKGQTAAQIVKPAESLMVLHDEEQTTLTALNRFLETHSYHGYPVVRNDKLLGYIVAEKAKAYIGQFSIWMMLLPETEDICSAPLVAEDASSGVQRPCTFSKLVVASNPDVFDLSSLLDDTVLQLRKDVPLQLVVNMFQKMVDHFPISVTSFSDILAPFIESSTRSLFSGWEAYWNGNEN